MRLLTKLAIILLVVQVVISMVGLTAIGYSGESQEFVRMESFENASSLRPSGGALDYLTFLGWGMKTSVTFIFDVIWSSISGEAISNLVLMFDPTGGAVLGDLATMIRLLVIAIFVLGLIELLRG